jgi:hypothetical protein
MKGVTAVLLAALVVLLSVIAYDLHRVAGVLVAPPAAAGSAAQSTSTAAAEHERRVQQAMRQLCEFQDCDHVVDEAAKRLKASRR